MGGNGKGSLSSPLSVTWAVNHDLLDYRWRDALQAARPLQREVGPEPTMPGALLIGGSQRSDCLYRLESSENIFRSV